MTKRKRRVGIYLRSDVSYIRRLDLETEDCHVVVVAEENLRLINVYRSFHPPGGLSASNFFIKQLSIVKNALCKNCCVMGT